MFGPPFTVTLDEVETMVATLVEAIDAAALAVAGQAV
jgi:hypothetical protein